MVNTKNFKWNELIYSETANKNNIDNTPPKEYIDNGIELIKFLQELRDAYGKPIMINSGYRCKELNDKVGGSVNSSHLYFLAADLRSANMNEFISFVREFYKDRKDYDQIIIEKSKRSLWVHIGIRHPKYGQRGQLFNMNV